MERYMEQQDEWEREGLLDPAWELQQRKVSYRKTSDRSQVSNKSRLPKTPQHNPDVHLVTTYDTISDIIASAISKMDTATR